MRFDSGRLLAVVSLLLAAAGLTWGVLAQPHSRNASAPPTTQPAGFAIVELFTSEGCSSCPPADALMAELTDEARKSGTAIYGLEFHVDYWNGLGWKDPFSSADFSQRQSAYARHMNLANIYTPQMVVNGTAEFVGSDRSAAKRTIDKALSSAVSTKVSLRPVLSSDTKNYDVTFTVQDAPVDTTFNLALVERGLTTDVKRGENGGQTLKHANVVRWFTSSAIKADGHGVVQVPKLPNSIESHLTLIGFVQMRGPGAIVAAVAEPVPSSK